MNEWLVSSGRARIMGIVNVTPDSFSDGNQFLSHEQAIAHGRALSEAGADIVDVGGESTRPGAKDVSNEDEINPIVSLVKGSTVSWDTKASTAIENHVKDSLRLYNKLLDSGVCREQARMILPQNIYTTYWGTVNLNNLVNFIHLRDHEGAQQEIQVVAQACKTIIYELWPETAKALFEVNHG